MKYGRRQSAMDCSEHTLLASFRCALEGIVHVARVERNFRLHVLAAVAVVAVGLWLRLSLQAWASLTLTIGSVLVAELLNTAAETLVDLVSPEYHPLAKRAKDMMAGAVLVMAITSVVVGLCVLGPPLWTRLGLAGR